MRAAQPATDACVEARKNRRQAQARLLDNLRRIENETRKLAIELENGFTSVGAGLSIIDGLIRVAGSHKSKRGHAYC